jgi:hypothetical protein
VARGWTRGFTLIPVDARIKVFSEDGKIRCFHAWGGGWKIGPGMKEYDVKIEGEDALLLLNKGDRATITLWRNTKDKNKFEATLDTFGLNGFYGTFVPVVPSTK